MFRTVAGFVGAYEELAQSTANYMGVLSDESLSQAVAEGHRTLGRVAWHVAQTIPEMMGRTGLAPDGPAEDAPPPSTVNEIVDAYLAASSSLIAQVRDRWTDETLLVEDEMYGSKWPRGLTLYLLVMHEVHHLGQMSVLMRQAGLRVPGVFGPSKEDWAEHGMPTPEI